MRNIPIVAIPNQSLSVTLGGARWDLRIRVAANTMVVDVHRDGEPVVLGQRAVANELIIPYSYLLSEGEYVNFGFTSAQEEKLWWENFGDTQKLKAVFESDLVDETEVGR